MPQHKTHRVTVVEQAASGVDDAGQYSLRGSGTAVLDLHLQVDFFCEDCVADEQNNWLQRRKLVRTRQEYRKLERALCQLLDEGSYEDLQGVCGVYSFFCRLRNHEDCISSDPYS